MSNINKKDNSNKGLSDTDYAKIVAALIGVEYPGDEYFDGSAPMAKSAIEQEKEVVSPIEEPTFNQIEDVEPILPQEEPKLVEQNQEIIPQEIEQEPQEEQTPTCEDVEAVLQEEVISQQIQSEPEEVEIDESVNLPVEKEETTPVLVETQQNERVRATPFRKQSYSQWQSARLRNFAKAGILIKPEENQIDAPQEEEVLNLNDEGVITVDEILTGDSDLSLNESTLSSEQQIFVEELIDEQKIEEIDIIEDAQNVVPTPVIVEEEIFEEDNFAYNEQVYDYDYEEPREIIVKEKTIKIVKEPPVMPQFKEEKPYFFAHIEEKPQKIKRKNNAPLIIPIDSKPVGFAPKGSSYREI